MDLEISNAALANGLRVVLVRDPRARDIQVTMRYGVGSVDDPPGQLGIAHLVEHLMFQQVLGSETIFAKLEASSHGFNAFTTQDATTFVTRAAPEQLDTLLAIESVRVGLRCTSITSSAFEREREVVVNELRMRSRLDELLTAFHRGVYTGAHPYARSSNPAQVAAITMEQACAFADEHYAPTNAVLVISGNLDEGRVSDSLTKLMSRIQRRDAVPAVAVARARAAAVKTNAPITDDAVLIAWPLPVEPEARARVGAVATIITAAIDSAVKGRVIPMALGDQRAPMFGVLVVTKDRESPTEVVTRVRKALDAAPSWFQGGGRLGDALFHRIQQLALFQAFAGFEDGSERDSVLAAQVLAGRDPKQVLASELQSLRRLTPTDASAIAAQLFAFELASVVVLEADEETRGGDTVTLTKPVHDLGQRREVRDPATAMQPVSEPLTAHIPDEVVTRTLPNGLRVVLLPVTSIPTVDVRIVFGAGTADEPADRRGVAMIAAEALTWKGKHVEDLLAFVEAGASADVEVTPDHVAFAARGLDMHLDYLLSGLHKLVVDGAYGGGARSMARALRARAKLTDDAGALTDAFRKARFGGAHPYVAAGLPRHVSPVLTLADAKEFRAAHFTPDNATLVISGRFDAELANRWIDHLFSRWSGKAMPRGDALATVSPSSIASDEALAQVQIAMTLPARGGVRAHRVVAAAMLREIVNDVRHQLGAAYTFEASYDELRLSTTYSIGGATDAPRTHEAIALIRDRLAQLRSDPDDAARAFVTARKQVLASLSASVGSAAVLGATVTRDLGLGRGVFADPRLAQEVHALTLDRMTPALEDLVLERAAILMRGPATDVTKAFSVLGRTPEMIAAQPDAAANIEFAAQDSSFDNVDDDDDERPSTQFLLGVSGLYTKGSVTGQDLDGKAFSAHFGLNIQRSVTAGLLFSYGTYASMHEVPFRGTQPLELDAVSFSLFVQRTFFDRVWGSLLTGFHFNGLTTDRDVGKLWVSGVGAGAEAGVDVLKLGRHRLAASIRYEIEFDSEADYRVLSFGAGYRFF